MANHGFLNRDGRNIDEAHLLTALQNVIGLGPAFAEVFTKAAISKFADPTTKMISLCDTLTNIHSNDQPSHSTGVEHEASLSREDRPKYDYTKAGNPSQRSPSPTQIAILLSHSKDGNVITMADFVQARAALWAKTYGANKALQSDPLDRQQHVIAAVEGCLLLGALSGEQNGGHYQISKAYAQSILQDEKFPVGWAPAKTNPMGIPQVMQCLAQEGISFVGNEVAELAKHWFGVLGL